MVVPVFYFCRVADHCTLEAQRITHGFWVFVMHGFWVFELICKRKEVGRGGRTCARRMDASLLRPVRLHQRAHHAHTRARAIPLSVGDVTPAVGETAGAWAPAPAPTT